MRRRIACCASSRDQIASKSSKLTFGLVPIGVPDVVYGLLLKGPYIAPIPERAIYSKVRELWVRDTLSARHRARKESPRGGEECEAVVISRSAVTRCALTAYPLRAKDIASAIALADFRCRIPEHASGRGEYRAHLLDAHPLCGHGTATRQCCNRASGKKRHSSIPAGRRHRRR